MLIKETKDDTNIWRNSLYSQIERMNNAAIYIISKVIYSSSIRSVKIPPQIHHGNRREKKILKCVWNHKRPKISEAIFSKTEGSQKHHISWFQIAWQFIVIETVWLRTSLWFSVSTHAQRPTKQSRTFRHKLAWVWASPCGQTHSESNYGISLISGAEKMGSTHASTWIGNLFLHHIKFSLKWITIPNVDLEL